MASLGGNVLQRTRCPYFRDVLVGGLQQARSRLRLRRHGRASTADLAVLGDQRPLHRQLSRRFRRRARGARRQSRHRGRRPAAARSPSPICTACPATRRISRRRCRPGELILGFSVAAGAVDAPLALSEDPRPPVLRIRARLGGGGAGPRRRRRARGAHRARRRRGEALALARRGGALCAGKGSTETAARAAAEAAFADAQAPGDRAFKAELGRRTLVRALLQCGAMEI